MGSTIRVESVEEEEDEARRGCVIRLYARIGRRGPMAAVDMLQPTLSGVRVMFPSTVWRFVDDDGEPYVEISAGRSGVVDV